MARRDELRRARAAACVGRNETKRSVFILQRVSFARNDRLGHYVSPVRGNYDRISAFYSEHQPQCVHSSFLTAIIIENIINNNNFA